MQVCLKSCKGFTHFPNFQQKRKQNRRQNDGVSTFLRPLPVKRVTYRFAYKTALTSTAGALFRQDFSAAQVQSLPANNWAEQVTTFSAYRVRRLSLVFIPVEAASTTLSQGLITVVPYGRGETITSLATSLPNSTLRMINSADSRMHTLSVSAESQIADEANTYSGTSNALPTINSFGFSINSDADFTASTTYWDVIVYWDVEFQTTR